MDKNYNFFIAHEEFLEQKLKIDTLCDEIDKELENYGQLEESVDRIDKSEPNSLEHVVGLESYKAILSEMEYTHEDNTLSLEEDRHGILERTGKIISDAINVVMNMFKELFTRIVHSIGIIESNIEGMIERLEKMNTEHFYKYLSEMDITSVYRYFSTMIRAGGNIDTNENLCKFLLKAEQSIGSPKLTAPMTNVIQSGLQRINFDKIVFTTEAVAKGMKPGLGVNAVLNKYLYDHIPEQIQSTVEKDHVIVVEYYGNRCAGIIARTGKFQYTKGSVTYSNTLTAFKELPSRTTLLNVLKMAKRLCMRLDGFKDLVDNDIETCKKIVFNFNKADRVIDDEDTSQTMFNDNMHFIQEYSVTAPRIGNSDMANYYMQIKNILHYGQLCLSIVDQDEER